MTDAGHAPSGSLSPRLSSALFAAAILFSSQTAQAQAAMAIELGVSRTRYADTLDASAVVLSPSLSFASSAGMLSATGSYSRFENERWAAQGNVSASAFTPTAGVFAAEAAAALGGSAHQDETRTGRVIGTGRVHLLGSTRGIWFGAGLGRMWDGLLWRPARLGEAGVWMRLGHATTSLKATPTVVADTIKYTDTQLVLAWASPRFELAGTFGARAGSRLPQLGGTAKQWGNGNATLWLTRVLALVGSVGTYPSDLTQGFPSGRFAMFGLRLAASGYRASDVSVEAIAARDASAESATAGSITDFRHERVGANQTLSVRAPHASGVEVMGDFSNWIPIRLVRTRADWWVATFPIRPGVYEMNVRANAGKWDVPPGLPELRDEFGGSVGILVVR